MTRVTESLSTSLSAQLPDTLDQARARVEDTLEDAATRIKESDAAGNARRFAAAAAASIAHGAGQAGLFLGRQSAALAKKGVARAKAAPVTSNPKPRGRKRITVFIVAGLIAVGGAVFVKSRRREHPPVASAPPRLDSTPAPAPAPTAPTAPVSGQTDTTA